MSASSFPLRPRGSARAATLEDITRAFVASGGRDPRAAAAFSDIGAAMLPRVEMSVAVTIARLIAGRDDVPEPVLAALAERGLKPRGARAVPLPQWPARDVWTTPADAPNADEQMDETAAAHFLAADSATRARMIDAATRLSALDSGPEQRRRIDAVSALALARAAERGDREDVTLILARALALPPARLAPLFDDAGGEALAVALKAAALDDDDAIRIFVGTGAPTLRAGSGLRAALAIFRGLGRPAAIRLLAAMTGDSWSPRAAAGASTPLGQLRREAASQAIFSPQLGRESIRPSTGRPHPGEPTHSLSPNLPVEVRRQPR